MPIFALMSNGVPSDLQVGGCGLSKGGQTLLDLVIDLDVLPLILPLGELLLVKLLFKLGLHVGHLLLLRATLVDELLGSAGRTRQHRCYKKYIHN